jgi:hypothetical protein
MPCSALGTIRPSHRLAARQRVVLAHHGQRSGPIPKGMQLMCKLPVHLNTVTIGMVFFTMQGKLSNQTATLWLPSHCYPLSHIHRVINANSAQSADSKVYFDCQFPLHCKLCTFVRLATKARMFPHWHLPD